MTKFILQGKTDANCVPLYWDNYTGKWVARETATQYGIGDLLKICLPDGVEGALVIGYWPEKFLPITRIRDNVRICEICGAITSCWQGGLSYLPAEGSPCQICGIWTCCICGRDGICETCWLKDHPNNAHELIPFFDLEPENEPENEPEIDVYPKDPRIIKVIGRDYEKYKIRNIFKNELGMLIIELSWSKGVCSVSVDPQWRCQPTCDCREYVGPLLENNGFCSHIIFILLTKIRFRYQLIEMFL